MSDDVRSFSALIVKTHTVTRHSAHPLLCCSVRFRTDLLCMQSLPPSLGSVLTSCVQLSSALGLPVFSDISLQVCSPSWPSQMSLGRPIHLKVSVPFLLSSNIVSHCLSLIG